MSAITNLKSNKDTILKIASEHGVKRVRLFGSVAREEDTIKSDIDVLVNFDEGRSLFDLISLKHDLEELLNQEIDVVTEEALHWSIRDKVLQEAVDL